MGLFDTVAWNAKLPDDAPEFLKECPVFQTYDLGRGMGDYEIDADGRFYLAKAMLASAILSAMGRDEEPQKIIVPYKSKRIELHASNLRGGAPRGKEYVSFTDNGEDYVEIAYVVWIRNGRAGPLREKFRTATKALPISQM